MHRIDITPLSSSADAEELRAALSSASPGSAFSVPLRDGSLAVLTLAACKKAPGTGGMHPHGVRPSTTPACRFVEELHPIIADRIKLGQARSSLQAANQLVAEGQYRGYGGTPENQAHYLAATYRKALAIGAFSKHLQLQSQ